MENEKNNFSGVSVNELVIIETHQRTGDDGKKKGHSWNEKGEIGIVVAISENKITIKKADGEEDTFYGNNDEYYYTVGKTSEVTFKEAIKKAIDNEQKEIDSRVEKRDEIIQWYKDFEDSISLLGKLKKFLKNN